MRSRLAVALLYDDTELCPQALALAEQSYRRAENEVDAARARDERLRRYPDFKAPDDS